MNRIEQLKLAISKVKKDVAMYKMKLVNLSSFVKTGERELAKYETELAELNKAKTGQVKIGDDLSGVDEIFITNSCGSVVASYTSLGSVFLNNYIKQGRAFYDENTAELFALREVTEYKIWCEFGNDVRVVCNRLKGFASHHLDPFLRFCYNEEAVKYNDVCDFLDTLSPDELNAIRSE